MTDSAAIQAAEKVCRDYGAQECVVLSTCNRTELWTYGELRAPLPQIFIALRESGSENIPYLVERQGEQAVWHLLRLSCGMRSQVFGEDQILTQVGHALDLARRAQTTGPILEMLFRTAVTAAKRVKSTIRLTETDRSMAIQAVDFLENLLGGLRGRPCLVIGNGEMGRLAAAQLLARGCRVRMTVRSYRHGDVLLPAGVQPISYDGRLEALREVDIVVSATTSPHYTVRAQQLQEQPLMRPTVFCDLAVPRDIDPAIAALPGAQVYDADQLCSGARDGNREAIQQAEGVLRAYWQEFQSWYTFRPLVSSVRKIGQEAAANLSNRMERTLRELPLEAEMKQALQKRMSACTEKVMGKMLFGLRETLPPELWERCIQGLGRTLQEGK